MLMTAKMTGRMNPKQRLLAAIRGQPVDRMPVMTYNFHLVQPPAQFVQVLRWIACR